MELRLKTKTTPEWYTQTRSLGTNAAWTTTMRPFSGSNNNRVCSVAILEGEL